MGDLLDEDTPGRNEPEFTVSELAGSVKRTLEGTFGRVRVKGEVGRLSRPSSGHLYFDLKDERAVIASVAWKGVAARLRTLPEEGMEVVATGKISTFGPQSKYQLIVDDIAPAGLGALMVMLEKRKKALEAEGLFAPDRKRPIPYLPEVIGVVTSPSGAVIRDILHRLRERFPRKVLLWPVVVQGEKCASEVSQAIAGFNRLDGSGLPRPDVIIVARGGGSLEDLWGFNEEVVVRAVAASAIPVISAVGHETDTTLIDYVADRRAPTPTAAAEMAVPVRVDIMAALASYDERRLRAMAKGLSDRGNRLRELGRVLPRPQAILGERAQAFDGLSMRLEAGLLGLVERRRSNLAQKTGGFGAQLLRRAISVHGERLSREHGRLAPALARLVGRRQDQFHRSARLDPQMLRRRLADPQRALESEFGRLSLAGRRALERSRDRLTAIERIRATLGHEATLKRGFAVVRDENGRVLPDRAAAQGADGLSIEFRDGVLPIGLSEGAQAPSSAPKTGKKRVPKATTDDKEQGSLF